MSEGCEWIYNESADFIRSSEELNLSNEVKDFIKNWAVSFRRQVTPRSKRYFCSPNNVFEIWVARIPDPDSNKGTSGGFRLVLFINLSDRSINSCKIKHRDQLGEKRERRSDQQRNEEYLKELKECLLKELDS